MNSRAYIIIGVTLLLSVSCGRQHKAEQTVKTFVDQYAETPEAISDRDFSDIGTTRHISDSLIDVMRHQGAPGFKKDVSYGQRPADELVYLRMKYVLDNDTLQNTFYLNQELTEVVAFK